jgi:ABC-type sulfate/molybdate transport systems ATPase subunit
MVVIETRNVSKTAGENILLSATSLEISAGSSIAIMGETGSGKSTLLKIMAGLLEPSSGAVYLRGKKLENPAEQLIPGHPAIAYLSQHFELRNNYKVIDVLAMAARLPEADCLQIIDLCRISHLLQRKTHEVSGGERQRIALARLLVAQPDVLLLDEPFTNLDNVNKSIIREVLQEIRSAGDLTCIMVSHHPEDVLPWAEKLIIMQKGSIIQAGTPEKVYHEPVNGYAASLTGIHNPVFPGEENMAHSIGIAGNLPYWIRPEQLIINGPEKGGVGGVITESIFFGHCWHVLVNIGYRNLTVLTSANKWTPGTEVSLSVRHQNDINDTQTGA